MVIKHMIVAMKKGGLFFVVPTALRPHIQDLGYISAKKGCIAKGTDLGMHGALYPAPFCNHKTSHNTSLIQIQEVP
jgi:hypothetical protein